MTERIRLPDAVGGGYGEFWRFRGRYRAVKGGRASKKSATTALWLIYNMMRRPLANALVIRRFFVQNRDSTYAQLMWAARRLGVYDMWSFFRAPMEAVYKKTGQRIIFRGLDDPLSVTSITVPVGALCWVWVEEASQIDSEADFNKLDLSIRGPVPEGYFKQITLTFNPWSGRHWLKARFFDAPSPDVLAMTTTYMDNEFLADDDRALFEKMKKEAPGRYRVEGLGEWGADEGQVYTDWTVEQFDRHGLVREAAARGVRLTPLFGLDFGYAADEAALICALVDEEAKRIYIFDEMYRCGMTNGDIAAVIKGRGYSKEVVWCDGAEPKSIEELRRLGIRARAASKGPDSLLYGVQLVRQYRMTVSPDCPAAINELLCYVWDKDRHGEPTGRPCDRNNHLMDALRYGLVMTARRAGRIKKEPRYVFEAERPSAPALTGGRAGRRYIDF